MLTNSVLINLTLNLIPVILNVVKDEEFKKSPSSIGESTLQGVYREVRAERLE